MDISGILVSAACGFIAAMFAILLAWGGLALSHYRLKTAISDLQNRVLVLSQRNANEASQRKRYPNPVELEALARQAPPKRRFSNDPFDVEHIGE